MFALLNFVIITLELACTVAFPIFYYDSFATIFSKSYPDVINPRRNHILGYLHENLTKITLRGEGEGKRKRGKI